MVDPLEAADGKSTARIQRAVRRRDIAGERLSDSRFGAWTRRAGAAVTLVTLIGCGEHASVESHTVLCRVTAEETGAPVADVQLGLLYPVAYAEPLDLPETVVRSNDAGEVHWRGEPPRSFSVEVQDGGYELAEPTGWSRGQIGSKSNLPLRVLVRRRKSVRFHVHQVRPGTREEFLCTAFQPQDWLPPVVSGPSGDVTLALASRSQLYAFYGRDSGTYRAIRIARPTLARLALHEPLAVEAPAAWYVAELHVLDEAERAVQGAFACLGVDERSRIRIDGDASGVIRIRHAQPDLVVTVGGPGFLSRPINLSGARSRQVYLRSTTELDLVVRLPDGRAAPDGLTVAMLDDGAEPLYGGDEGDRPRLYHGSVRQGRVLFAGTSPSAFSATITCRGHGLYSVHRVSVPAASSRHGLAIQTGPAGILPVTIVLPSHLRESVDHVCYRLEPIAELQLSTQAIAKETRDTLLGLMSPDWFGHYGWLPCQGAVLSLPVTDERLRLHLATPDAGSCGSADIAPGREVSACTIELQELPAEGEELTAIRVVMADTKRPVRHGWIALEPAQPTGVHDEPIHRMTDDLGYFYLPPFPEGTTRLMVVSGRTRDAHGRPIGLKGTADLALSGRGTHLVEVVAAE